MLTQPRTQVLAFSFLDFRTLQHGSFHRPLGHSRIASVPGQKPDNDRPAQTPVCAGCASPTARAHRGCGCNRPPRATFPARCSGALRRIRRRNSALLHCDFCPSMGCSTDNETERHASHGQRGRGRNACRCLCLGLGPCQCARRARNRLIRLGFPSMLDATSGFVSASPDSTSSSRY